MMPSQPTNGSNSRLDAPQPATPQQPSPASSATPPSTPRDPKKQQSLYRLWAGLVLQAADEGDLATAGFYLGAGESQGLDRQEIVRLALESQPDDPLLASLTSGRHLPPDLQPPQTLGPLPPE
jgi:hypothetical protein